MKTLTLISVGKKLRRNFFSATAPTNVRRILTLSSKNFFRSAKVLDGTKP